MNPNKKKMTVPDFKKFKAEGRKFTFVTAYDYTMASIINDSETEVILVGDSMAMVVLGRNSTVGVTVDDIIHHTTPVVLGAPQTFVIGDMPFGSYNVSVEQAIENANRILMETNCDAVKLEGGKDMAPAVESMVKAGISVVGHIGLTPQTSVSFGGFKVQGGTPESAVALIEDAKALEAAGAIGIVVECVPSVVAKAMTEAVSIPTALCPPGALRRCGVPRKKPAYYKFLSATPLLAGFAVRLTRSAAALPHTPAAPYSSSWRGLHPALPEADRVRRRRPDSHRPSPQGRNGCPRRGSAAPVFS